MQLPSSRSRRFANALWLPRRERCPVLCKTLIAPVACSGAAVGLTALLALGVGVFFAYRWAEPRPRPAFIRSGEGTRLTIRLENTRYRNEVGGRANWALWAKSLDLDRAAGASVATIQTATLTDIRDGALYGVALPADLPKPSATTPSSPLSTAFTPDAKTGERPVAAFSAQQGKYVVGGEEPLPPDMATLFLPQWQFHLTGKVAFTTQAGDHLDSDSLTILQIIARRTGKVEQRIVCDSGVTVTRKDIRLQANQARYDPAARIVECLGGVRAAFPKGTVQAERVFWSLKDGRIRCPESASGVLDGGKFTAEGVDIDLPHGKRHFKHLILEGRTEMQAVPRLP